MKLETLDESEQENAFDAVELGTCGKCRRRYNSYLRLSAPCGRDTTWYGMYVSIYALALCGVIGISGVQVLDNKKYRGNSAQIFPEI